MRITISRASFVTLASSVIALAAMLSLTGLVEWLQSQYGHGKGGGLPGALGLVPLIPVAIVATTVGLAIRSPLEWLAISLLGLILTSLLGSLLTPSSPVEGIIHGGFLFGMYAVFLQIGASTGAAVRRSRSGSQPVAPDGRPSRWPSEESPMSFDRPSPLHAHRRLRRR